MTSMTSMTVVRMITFKGSKADVERQMVRSMSDGIHQPAKVEITIATVFNSEDAEFQRHPVVELHESPAITRFKLGRTLSDLGPVLLEDTRLTGTDIKKMNEGSDVIDDTEDSITKIISRHVSKNIRKAKERK